MAAFLSLLLLFAGLTAKPEVVASARELPDAPMTIPEQTASQNTAPAGPGTQTSPAANPSPAMTPEEQR
jgi:hypothetical protein